MWKIPLACDLAFFTCEKQVLSLQHVFFAQVKEMQQLFDGRNPKQPRGIYQNP